MKNAILVGYGKMGRMVEEALAHIGGFALLGVVDVGLYSSPEDVPGRADVLLDFSYPGNLDPILSYARQTGCALVLGTTGYNESQIAKIHAMADICPVIQSYNYSTGVAAMRRAVADVARALMPEYDVEIVETHHRQKEDAPSGTAKMLLDTVDPSGEYAHLYGREGRPGKRGHEIGVHALRGGTVAGEHSVFFYGVDEVIEIRHSASSRRVFAEGAARAARFLVGRTPGFYHMDDVLKGEPT